MKSEGFSEKLENLLIQKLCEMGKLSYILRRKNYEIEKMDTELEFLKNILNEKNNSKKSKSKFYRRKFE